MAETVFYSWQSDRPNRTCRSFIERALQNALKQIARDVVIDAPIREELELDQDTRGVPGTPPVVDTIFGKIDAAAVFVADLTFVGKRANGRPTPNPNVLIEYGWALRSLGHPLIIAVMNSAYGKPTRENLPFDLGHFRFPIQYACPEDADEAARGKVRDELVHALVVSIRAVLLSDDLKRKRSPEEQFVPREPKESRGLFRSKTESIGLVDLDDRAAARDLEMSEAGARFWLRLMPSVAPSRDFTVSELRQQVRPRGNVNALPTLTIVAGHPLWVRGADGYGAWTFAGNGVANSVAYAFTTGEVWMIDQRSLRLASGQNFIPLNENLWERALAKYTEFLQQLGLKPPFRWIAGVEGVKGRGLLVGSDVTGACATDIVEVDGFHTPDERAGISLQPFFEKIFDVCGVARGR